MIQNQSVQAGLKLNYYGDLCDAVQTAMVDSQRKAYANAVDACLKEKQAQGYPLDKAMEACQRRTVPVTGFYGELLGELDLGRELEKVFDALGLSPGAKTIAQGLGDGARVGRESMSSQPDPHALSRLYDEMREGYGKRLNDLIEKAARHEAIDPGELAKAVPEGAPTLAEDEVRVFSLLPPHERAAVVASLSSAWAIFAMGRQIREVERAIEVLQGVPTVDEAKRKILEDRLARVRQEKTRLMEHFRDQALVMEALGTAKSLAGREYARRVADIQSRQGEDARKEELVRATARIGALPDRRPAPKSGGAGAPARTPGDCGNCGFQTSFGVYGESRK